jgi:hypothetical protein
MWCDQNSFQTDCKMSLLLLPLEADTVQPIEPHAAWNKAAAHMTVERCLVY